MFCSLVDLKRKEVEGSYPVDTGSVFGRNYKV